MSETSYNAKEWMRVVVMLKTKEIITNKTVCVLLKTLIWHQDGLRRWGRSIVVSSLDKLHYSFCGDLGDKAVIDSE